MGWNPEKSAVGRTVLPSRQFLSVDKRVTVTRRHQGGRVLCACPRGSPELGRWRHPGRWAGLVSQLCHLPVGTFCRNKVAKFPKPSAPFPHL